MNPSIPLKYLYKETYFGSKLGDKGLCKKICYRPDWSLALDFVEQNGIEFFSPWAQLVLNPGFRRWATIPPEFKRKFPEGPKYQLSFWTVNNQNNLNN